MIWFTLNRYSINILPQSHQYYKIQYIKSFYLTAPQISQLIVNQFYKIQGCTDLFGVELLQLKYGKGVQEILIFYLTLFLVILKHIIMKSQSKLRKKSKNYFEYDFKDQFQKPCLRKIQNKRQKGKVHFEVSDLTAQENESNRTSISNERKAEKNQLNVVSLEKIIQQDQISARKESRKISIVPYHPNAIAQNSKSNSKKSIENNKITEFICFTPSSDLYVRNFIEEKNFKSLSIQRSKASSQKCHRNLILSAKNQPINNRCQPKNLKKTLLPQKRKNFFTPLHNCVNSKLARCISLGAKNIKAITSQSKDLMQKWSSVQLNNVQKSKKRNNFMISKQHIKIKEEVTDKLQKPNLNSLQLLVNQSKPKYQQLYMISSKYQENKSYIISSFSLHDQVKLQPQVQNFDVITSESEDEDRQSQQDNKQIKNVEIQQHLQSNQRPESSKYFIKVSLGKIIQELENSKNRISSSVLIRKKNFVNRLVSEIGDQDDGNKILLQNYKKLQKQSPQKAYSKSDISSNNDLSNISFKSFNQIDNTPFFNVLEGQPIYFINKNFRQSINNQSILIQIIRIFLRSNKNTLNYLTLQVWFRFNNSIIVRRVTWEQSKKVQILQQTNNLRKGIKNKTTQRYRRKKIMNIWEKRIKMILSRIFLKSLKDEKQEQQQERQNHMNIRQQFRSKTTTQNQQFKMQSERTELDNSLFGKRKSKFTQQIMNQRKLGNLNSARHLDDMIQFIEDYSVLQRSYLGYTFIKQEQSQNLSNQQLSRQLVTSSLKKRWFNKEDISDSSVIQTLHRIKKACQFYMLVYLNDTLFLIKSLFKETKTNRKKIQKFPSMCSLKVQTQSVIPQGRATFLQNKQLSHKMLLDLTKNQKCQFSQELNSLYFDQLFENYELNCEQNLNFSQFDNFYDLQTDSISEEYKGTLRFRKRIQKYMHSQLIGVHIKSAFNKKDHYFIRELNRIHYPQYEQQKLLKQIRSNESNKTTQIIQSRKSPSESYKPSNFSKCNSHDQIGNAILQNELQLSTLSNKKKPSQQNYTFGWRKQKQYVFLNEDTVNFFKQHDCFNYGVIVDSKNSIEEITNDFYYFVELYSNRINRIKLDRTQKQINQAFENLLQNKIIGSQSKQYQQQDKRNQFYIYVKQGIHEFSIKLSTQDEMERFLILNLPQHLSNNIKNFCIQGFFQRHRKHHSNPMQIFYDTNLANKYNSLKKAISLKHQINEQMRVKKLAEAIYHSKIVKKCRMIKNKFTIVDISLDIWLISFTFTNSMNKRVHKFCYPLIDFCELTKKLMKNLSDQSINSPPQFYRQINIMQSSKFAYKNSKQKINSMIEWELKSIEKFIFLLFFHKKLTYSGLTLLSLDNLKQIENEGSKKNEKLQRMTVSTFKNQHSMSSFKRRNNSHFEGINLSTFNENTLGSEILNGQFTQNYNILKKATIKIHYGIYAFITIYKLIGFDTDQIKVQVPRFQKTYFWDVNDADSCHFSEIHRMITNYLKNQVFKNQIQQTNQSLQKRFEKQYGHLVHNFSYKSTRKLKGMRPSVLEPKINIPHQNLMNFMDCLPRRKVGVQPKRKSLYSHDSNKLKGLKNKQSMILDIENFVLQTINEQHKIEFFTCGRFSYYIKIFTCKNLQQNSSGKITIIIHKKYSISYLKYCLEISEIIRLLNRKSMKDWILTTQSNFFDVILNKQEQNEVIFQRKLMPSEWNKILSFIHKAIKISNGKIFNISRNLRYMFQYNKDNQQRKSHHKRLKQSLKCQIGKKHLVQIYSYSNEEDNLLTTFTNNFPQRKVKALYKDIKQNKVVIIDQWTASFGTQIPFKQFNNRLFRRFCRDIIKRNQGILPNYPSENLSSKKIIDKPNSKSCYIIQQMSLTSEKQDE